ncbi:MAG: SDR family NAD(P)-dependent oxidoreductase [Bacteroidales bacterium]|nr:SDR family NAD(P)-dependent oxidoreductase [Bacteroidales bacterium]
MLKRIVIVGASSGLGKEIALIFLEKGWKVGIASRNIEALKEIEILYPQRVVSHQIDINDENAIIDLENLIEELGGIDVYFHSSGIGSQNTLIDINVEISTCKTNVLGFTRMVDYMYNYFKTNNISGQICVISSIAGTKGLGVSPAYSATKRFQNTYIECLEQLSHMQKLNISFTDIRPGFVKTALLNDGNNYPMLMGVKYAAKKIVSAVERKKRIAIVDWKYAILVKFWKLIPRWLWVRLPVKTK